MRDGSLEPVRCGASNRCDYCAMFAALEAALVLKLDAQMEQPTVGITTTTRRPDFTFKELRKAEQFLWRALRKGSSLRRGRRSAVNAVEAFPDLRYVGFLEWTTGEGTHAQGHRRPHVHHLVKGIPPDHPLLEQVVLDDGAVTNLLEQHVAELWQAYTGDAYVVDCRPLRTPAGAIAYLALHHHKRCQAPPPGFSGRRLRPSRATADRPGYYERPIDELRALARELASHERVVMAAKRAVEIEIDSDAGRIEDEADASLTEALVDGLRSLAREPLELQYSVLDGDAEFYVDEKRELVARTAAALERIRTRNPPELVRVREREELDEETGVSVRRAIRVLGPAVTA